MQGRRDLSAAPHQTHLLCSLTALGGSSSSEGSETSVSKHQEITAGGGGGGGGSGGGGACGGATPKPWRDISLQHHRNLLRQHAANPG